MFSENQITFKFPDVLRNKMRKTRQNVSNRKSRDVDSAPEFPDVTSHQGLVNT